MWVSLITLAIICCSITTMTVMAFKASLPRRPFHQDMKTAADHYYLLMAPLSNEEVFARFQQQQQPKPYEEENLPPMLYDDDMLADMQSALLTMEKRVKEGPGSLTANEKHTLEQQLSKIIIEMKQNEHKKPPRPAVQTTSESTTPVTPSQQPATPPPSMTTTTTTTPAETVNSAVKVIDIDTPADEGREYDGYGGMGQAPGTKNTYIIDGMDEMTPAEYQKALQDSVIDRQRQRKQSGVTGNMSSWNYLNSLTGESGVLKKPESNTDDNPVKKDSFMYKKPEEKK